MTRPLDDAANPASDVGKVRQRVTRLERRPLPSTDLLWFYTTLNSNFTVTYDTAAGWKQVPWDNVYGPANAGLAANGSVLLGTTNPFGGTWHVFFSAVFEFTGGTTDFIGINFETDILSEGSQTQIVDPSKGYTYNASVRKQATLTGSRMFRVQTVGAGVNVTTSVGQRVSAVAGDVVLLATPATSCWGYKVSTQGQ